MEFFVDYALFLLKAVTIVAAFLFIVAGAIAIGQRHRHTPDGHIEVQDLNDRFQGFEDDIKSSIFSDVELKAWHKEEKRKEKAERKAEKKHKDDEPSRKRIFVLDFDGDLHASALENLREEISAILTLATSDDEVLLRLESGGGMVHTYGLAASQLQRLVSAGVALTVSVDKVAASGGYMMACIAPRIIAAPFAIIGSIGVMAQLPNFHRLLKKHDVDIELHTAGEFKRTLTVLGENTEKGRRKFVEELEDTHVLFKEFVGKHRPQLDIDSIATGEVWYGVQALENKLIDTVQTSDEFLLAQRHDCDLFRIEYVEKKHWQDRIGTMVEASVERTASRLFQRLTQRRFW